MLDWTYSYCTGHIITYLLIFPLTLPHYFPFYLSPLISFLFPLLFQGKLWDWDPSVPVSAFPHNSTTQKNGDESNKEKNTSEKWDREKGVTAGKGASTRPGTAIETCQIQLDLDNDPTRPNTAIDGDMSNAMDVDADKGFSKK